MTYLLLSTLLICADWGQTRYIATTPGYFETNPLLGRTPTTKQVDFHFIGAIGVNAGAGFLLPKKYRKYFWGGVAVMQLNTVARNYSIGVEVTI